MFSFETLENAKIEIKKISAENKIKHIYEQAAKYKLSPSKLIDAVRDEIAELLDGTKRMSNAKRQSALLALEIELYTLRRCYHTMLAVRRVKAQSQIQPKAHVKATRKKISRKVS
jgi:hypothetical protein